MYIYQESTYYFDDFNVEEKITKKVKVESLLKAFALITAWISAHDGCWPEDLCGDGILEICIDEEDNTQDCAKIFLCEEE